jgi:hypothetical protein
MSGASDRSRVARAALVLALPACAGLVLHASSPAPAPVVAVAPACAATPQEAWTLAQQAVAANDAGLATERLTPAYRTRNALEMAIGASMMAEIGGLAGEGSGSGAKAAAAKAAETKLLAELDALLRKYKAPTIKEIGTPRMMKLEDPKVLAKFEKVDHVAYAREMETFFGEVEKAAEAAGVKGERTKLDEIVVGGGDLKAPLTAMKVSGDTATLPAGRVTMRFVKVGGCWLIDGRDSQ